MNDEVGKEQAEGPPEGDVAEQEQSANKETLSDNRFRDVIKIINFDDLWGRKGR